MSTTPTRAKRRREVRIVSKPKVPLPPQLKRVNLNAAGIDIGAEEHWVAVPQGRDTEGQGTRRFGAFTGDLCALADWLKRCEIETVAMESTGVYWIALQHDGQSQDRPDAAHREQITIGRLEFDALLDG